MARRSQRHSTTNAGKQTADSHGRWDDWVPQERIRKLTEEHKELATNLKKDMDAQRRAASGKPPSTSTKKRPFGSDLTGSSARGSEDRSSAAPQLPRGTKRAREIEGIDKVGHYSHCSAISNRVLAITQEAIVWRLYQGRDTSRSKYLVASLLVRHRDTWLGHLWPVFWCSYAGLRFWCALAEIRGATLPEPQLSSSGFAQRSPTSY